MRFILYLTVIVSIIFPSKTYAHDCSCPDTANPAQNQTYQGTWKQETDTKSHEIEEALEVEPEGRNDDPPSYDTEYNYS